jgi:predicted DNA binding CopG/RHH family protein
MPKKLNLPAFKNENEERDFWANLDLSEYFSNVDFESVSFPNLKPSSRSISLRLPESMLMRLKEQANELHIPYQSLIKQYIAKNIAEDE